MGRNLKILISIILIVLLGGVVTLYAYVDSNSTATNLQSTAQQHTNHDEVIQGMINELYYDENKDFLSEGLTDEQVDQVRDEIDIFNLSTSDKNKYLQEVDDVTHRYEAQKAVNAFFAGTRDAIRGNTVTANLEYRKNLDQEAVLEVKETFYYELETEKEVNSSESGQEAEVDETLNQLDKFQLTINQILDQAEVDLDTPQVVKNAFEAIEKIDIIDGNMGRIALAMNKFDQELLKIEESHAELFSEMESLANDYSQKFLKEVVEIAETIPQYYEILLIAVEPSERLLELLKDNRTLFIEEITEESSVEVEESAELPLETPNSSFEYEYQDDYDNDYNYNDYIPPVTPIPDGSEEDPGSEVPEPTNPDEEEGSDSNQQNTVGPNSRE